MNNMNLFRGLFLIAFALIFGGTALTYNIGQFSRSGPGLFPLLVSCMLLAIGIVTVVRSRFVPPVPISHNYKNIAVILASLCAFAVVSQHINMLLGIVVLVFCATYAGTNYSVLRNVKITAGLVGVAFIFKDLLGLNLPLL
jgi:hypothetical protein